MPERAGLYMGRVRITADYEDVTDENVLTILRESEAAYLFNKAQMLYLWRYYKGDQPVLGRKKDVRPSINNRIVENHAQEIVNFKIGYQLAEPLQYTLRNHEGTTGPEGGEGETDERYGAHLSDLNELNSLMEARDKAPLDRDLFEHMCVCGVGYRLVEAARDPEEAPFDLFTLDPWSTYVVYSSAYHGAPLMAVWVGKEQDNSRRDVYNVYTRDAYYLVVGNEIVEKSRHTYSGIPIIEYQLNGARMGVFEPVLSLLDAINALESSRMDGIEQTVQSLMKFVNCDVDEATFEAMLQLGAVKVNSPEGKDADVDFIVNELDQTQTQVTKDDLYQAIVNICGMPNRSSSGASTSDTGAAVLLRDGWTLAESHAKSYELQFKRAERRFLRVVLGICEQSADVSVELRLRDIELTFNRRNYENVATKAQVLTGMLACDSIHPELAFRSCGLFTDPEAAYLQSRRWTEERKREGVETALRIAGAQEEPEPPSADAPAPATPDLEKGDDATAHAAANA